MRSTRGTLLAATLLAATATTALAAEPEWIRQFGTTSADEAYDVAVGPDGRVTVVGTTHGRLFGGANKGTSDAFVITFDRDGSELWRRQPGTPQYDIASAVATDAAGNVYVVGGTNGALGGADKGAKDAFVIKFDRDGRYLWKRQPGTTGSEGATGVAADADGAVSVVGYTDGALGGPKTGGSDLDAFAIRYDRDGRIVWKRQPGTSYEYDGAEAVAADAEGNVYMVGWTWGALGGTHKGNDDAFVIKFDRDGRILWKRQPGAANSDGAWGVAAGGDGMVYVVGGTDGALGGTHKGYTDPFLFGFDRDGRQALKRQPGTTEGDNALDVAIDAFGTVSVVGYSRGALGGAHKGEEDAFVIRYGRDGGVLWSDQPGSVHSEWATGVATDADGAVYVVGRTSGSLPGNTSLGDYDAFLIKYGPDGPR